MVIGKFTSKNNVAIATEANKDALAASLRRALHNPLQNDHKPPENPDNKGLRAALRAIESALFVMDDMREKLIEASQLVLKAGSSSTDGGRALLAERYDEIRLSFDPIVKNADPDAQKLLGAKSGALTVRIGGAQYAIACAKVDISKNGLNLPPPLDAFMSDKEIAETLQHIKKATEKIAEIADGYLSDAIFLSQKLVKNTGL